MHKQDFANDFIKMYTTSYRIYHDLVTRFRVGFIFKNSLVILFRGTVRDTYVLLCNKHRLFDNSALTTQMFATGPL